MYKSIIQIKSILNKYKYENTFNLPVSYLTPLNKSNLVNNIYILFDKYKMMQLY